MTIKRQKKSNTKKRWQAIIGKTKNDNCKKHSKEKTCS